MIESPLGIQDSHIVVARLETNRTLRVVQELGGISSSATLTLTFALVNVRSMWLLIATLLILFGSSSAL
jgi:hypothetical protein